MVLSTVEGVELLVAFEAVVDILVCNPLLLRAKRSLDYGFHFFVHSYYHQYQIGIICSYTEYTETHQEIPIGS